MEKFLEVFDPNFLLRNSVYISLLVGLTCPLVGVYLVLRRTIFLGVAMPQISSCGIAFAFALHAWGRIPHMEGSEHGLALAGSTVFTVAAILVLSAMERRGRGMAEGRTGVAYVLAGAWSILLLVNNPFGEHGLLNQLKGEIIAISDHDLILTGVAFGVVLALLFLFHKEFLLVSFDREMAITLKKSVQFWDSFLFLLIGVTISMSVLSVGPMVTFGFLIIPPLTAHNFSKHIFQFSILSAGIGVFSALLGFCIANRWEFPVGPTDVALLGVLYALGFVVRQLMNLSHKPVPLESGAR